MFDKRELSKDELEAELAVELPEREAMGGFNIYQTNFAWVDQYAKATAISYYGNAWASATNVSVIYQNNSIGH